jgi:uncharacterized membrane protein YphA (DoxX/SURF4 family)
MTTFNNTTAGMADAGRGGTKSTARYFPATARVLMGLVFFVFGLNGFLHFIPQPATLPNQVADYMGALLRTGYMLPLIMGTQLVVGVLLLVNRFVPLALVLIAPVIVNIIGFHIFLNLSGIVPGAIVAVLEVYLIRSYWSAFRAIFVARATPDPK